MKRFICRFFHKIDTIHEVFFIDITNGKYVGKYHCKKCNSTFMAYHKKGLHRLKSNYDL